MEADQLHANITHLGHCGIVLSTEERANLVSSLDMQKLKGGFERMLFWGVIQGTAAKYYVAQGYQTDPLDKRIAIYSMDGCRWGLLPPPSKETLEMTKTVRGRFTGDPSYVFNYVMRTGSEQTTPDDEKQVDKETFSIKEEDRLAGTVALIDHDAVIVPRGCYLCSPKHTVSVNRAWTGLTDQEARNSAHYMHLRSEYVELGAAPFNVPSIDFMPSIENKEESLSWVIQEYRGSAQITLKNLYWEGYCFYIIPNTRQFGSLYVGLGEANLDLPFMV